MIFILELIFRELLEKCEYYYFILINIIISYHNLYPPLPQDVKNIKRARETLKENQELS